MLDWVRACNAGYASAEAQAPLRALAAFAGERRHFDAALRWLRAQGEWAKAEALHAESLQIARELARELATPESRRDVGISLWNLAAAADALGQRTDACRLLREAEPIFEYLAEFLPTPQARSELEQLRERLAGAGCPPQERSSQMSAPE